jgi:hypothetical protein
MTDDPMRLNDIPLADQEILLKTGRRGPGANAWAAGADENRYRHRPERIGPKLGFRVVRRRSEPDDCVGVTVLAFVEWIVLQRSSALGTVLDPVIECAIPNRAIQRHGFASSPQGAAYLPGSVRHGDSPPGWTITMLAAN